jgi:16S rRNA (cytosine1402-N4)-methyltransferase
MTIASDPEASSHIPVLLEPVLDLLRLSPGGTAIDGTTGGGGHTAHFLERTGPGGRVLAMDADPAAVRRVTARFPAEISAGRLAVVQANFGNLRTTAQHYGFEMVDAILLDLGVSSFQLATAARGFSFGQDGPLDMRFDPTQGVSAAEIVNTWPETELADLIYKYGEETHSRQIARLVVKQRPITTTSALAAVVEKAVGGRRGSRIHPATKTFQALRVVVNRELEQISGALPQALDLLKPGGRLAIISFHSLEDRIVKRWMQQEAAEWIADSMLPTGGRLRQPTLTIVTKKPVVASPEQIAANPRSRSAKLRVAERTS